MFLV
ncbi:hypothetical protein YPPY10_1269, partial [Yersinia pestis PY-10]|jgi:translation initiation factor 3 subunit A